MNNFTPRKEKFKTKSTMVGVMSAGFYCCHSEDEEDRYDVLFELLAQDDQRIYLEDQKVIDTFEYMFQFAAIKWNKYCRHVSC